MSHPPKTHAQPGAAGTHTIFGMLWLLLGVAAALLLAAAVTSDRGLLWWLAALTATASGLFLAMSGAGRNARRRVHLDDGAITVQMRRTFPLAAAVFAATVAAFLGVNAATADDTVVRLAAGLVCLLCLAPLPDLLRAVLTRTHLTFDATHLAVRSWATDASIDWDDVVGADVGFASRPVVRILACAQAPSLKLRRLQILLPLEPRADEGHVVVTALAFDEPWLLAGRLATLVNLTPADRAERLSRSTVEMLTGQGSLPA